MKIKSKLITVFLAITFVLFFGLPVSSSMVQAAAKARLKQTSVTVTVKKTTTLTYYYNGKKVSPSKVTWGTKNRKIAKISKKGVVTGVKAGTTKVYGKYKGKTVYCKVTVKPAVSPWNQDFKVISGAKLSSKTCQLVSGYWGVGLVVSSSQYDTSDLTFSMDYYINNQTGTNSTDGFSVQFTETQPSVNNFRAGINMGIYNGSYAVELDAWGNGGKDGNGTSGTGAAHVSILKDSVDSHLTYKMCNKLMDGAWHTLKITLDDGEVTAYIDNVKQVTYYFGDSFPGSAYIVITGTSGAGYCNSYIRNISVE